MLDIRKIKKRLKDDFTHIKTFYVGEPAETVYVACNFNDENFVVVSVYLDSEIGGHYTLEFAKDMEYVYSNFDTAQAEVFRNSIIEEVHNGSATVLGDMNPKELH